MDIFSIKKNKRKEVGSGFTPSLPRQGSIVGEKNSLPPTANWNYTSRSSSISNDDSVHRTGCKFLCHIFSFFVLPSPFFFLIIYIPW
jgi:hypothetical protein